MRSTAQIRALWEPHCTNHLETLRTAYEALDKAFKDNGYVVRKEDTGAANCRHITGGTGYSLHAYFDGARFTFYTGAVVTMAVAVDVNWKTNPYGPRLITDRPPKLIQDIRNIKTVDGLPVWGWGGDYRGNKDAMHNECLLSPAELARGIVGHTPVSTPSTPSPPTTGGKCPEWHPLLRMGEVGAHVNHLQSLLQRTGAVIQPANYGHFEQTTKNAVLNFQTWAHLSSDGIVGPKTWGTLHHFVDGLTI